MAVIEETRVQNPSVIAQIAGPVGAVYGALATWNSRRKTHNALSALTDRELSDIGLIRSDIDRM